MPWYRIPNATVVAILLLAVSGAGSAWASTPPSSPGAPAATLGSVTDPRPDAQLAWSPASDSDGTVVGYQVQHAPAAGEPFIDVQQVAAPSATLADLVRGRTHRVRVVAIDDAGDRSVASVEVEIAVPRLASAIGIRQLVRGGQSRSCSRACTRLSLVGVTLRIASTAPIAQAGRRVRIDMLHRAPSTRRFRLRTPVYASLTSEGMATLKLNIPRLTRAPGTWCMRATIAATDELQLASSPRSCLRLRPPISIGWAGDIVVGSSYGLPPRGSMHMFDAVLALIRAPQLMIGNYEGTLSTGGRPRCGGGAPCYIFQAPPGRARALAHAGFDVMTLANNHGLDMGVGARTQTVRALARAGVGSAGLPGQVTLRQVADTRVAIVGISPYPGTTSMRNASAVRALVTKARRQADVVVVTMHVGLEGPAGAHVPRGADYGTHTRAAAHSAVAAGADIVFGSGPHVVRGIERYRGRYIVYSTGNFAGWRNFAVGGLTAQSGLVQVSLDHTGAAHAARWHGVRLVGPGLPVLDRGGSVVRRVRALSRADFGRRAVRMRADGSFR